MRHTAAFRYQFPVTAYVTPLVFQNPPAPADIQEKILATDGEAASIFIMLDELFNSSKLKNGELIYLFIPESGRFSYTTALLKVECV